MEVDKNELSFLDKGIGEEEFAELDELEIIMYSVRDLWIVDLLTRHAFKLAQNRPIYYRKWNIASRRYEIVAKEVW